MMLLLPRTIISSVIRCGMTNSQNNLQVGPPKIESLDSNGLLRLNFDVHLSGGAAAAVIVWEAFLTLEDEIRYVWSKPHNVRIKWRYLFAKWFGVIQQLVLHVVVLLSLSYAPVPQYACVTYHAAVWVAFHLLLLNLDVVLVLQICAMCKRQSRSVWMAITTVCIEMVISMTTCFLAVSKEVTEDLCIVSDPSILIICMTITVAIAHCFLSYLLYRKRPPLQNGRVNQERGIVYVVLRDSAFASLGLVAIAVTSITCFWLSSRLSSLTHPWFPVIPSLVTSRIILNMQSASDIGSESGVELTTQFGGSNLSNCPTSMFPSETESLRRSYQNRTTFHRNSDSL